MQRFVDKPSWPFASFRLSNCNVSWLNMGRLPINLDISVPNEGYQNWYHMLLIVRLH